MDTIWLWVLAATIVAGVGSVWVAAWLTHGVLRRYTQHMLSFAAGALLGTAFLHLMPEALETGGDPHTLLTTLLGGLVFFFVLDKAELYHHGHEHGGGPGHGVHPHAHGHAHGHDHASGSWVLLLGDSVHAFGDGVLIASAFLVDLHLGLLAALAVMAHEVPHHMGDLAVVRQASGSDRGAALKVSMAGTVTALGGMMGVLLLGQLDAYLPLVLMLASSSFIYVALADLIPQLHKRPGLRAALAQLLWLGLGLGLIVLASGGMHQH
jgi:zinc and cadmium transporter